MNDLFGAHRLSLSSCQSCLLSCQAFSKLDPDNSGFIEQAELVDLLKGVIAEKEAIELIRSADLADGDGRVSKEEFMSTVSILWNAHATSDAGSPKASCAGGGAAGSNGVTTRS